MSTNVRGYAVLLLLLLSFFQSFAQKPTVSGTVLSETDGSPLSGVNITNKATKKHVLTNGAGYFTIEAAVGDALVFSYVGFAAKEVKVGDSKLISVKMTEGDKSLNDVIVTAYGVKQSKRGLAYQVQEIQGGEISDTRRENFFNALAGKVAGLTVTPSTGSPGASTQIMLRGAVSMDGNNQPLIVVDGVPYDNQTLNQENIVGNGANRNTDYGNRAMDINPEDIESLVILKGPEAAALYGSDGASGALIITTRKGAKGKGSVYYDNSFKWEKVYRFPETQQVYGRGTNGVNNKLATTEISSISTIDLFRYFGDKYAPGTKLYNNMKAFFKTGFTQNHNLSIDGGNEGVTYRISGNYLNQDGMVPNTGYTKYSSRMSGSLKISPKMNLTTSFTYTNSRTKKAPKGTGSYFLTLLTFPADEDVTQYLNADGSRKFLRSASDEYDNPFWDANKNSLSDKVDRFNGNINYSYDPFPWLNLGLTTGLDFYSQIGDAYTHPLSRAGVSTNGYFSIYEQSTRNINNQIKLLFKKRIGKSFNNTLLLGFNNESNRTEIQSQDGTQFYEQEFRSINNTLLSSRSSMASIVASRKARFFGNYTLSYENMVTLSLAGSKEGNSTLGSKKNPDKYPFYNFGSASLSFVFTDLEQLKDIQWLNFGKLRLSYGSTGKAPVYAYRIDESFTNSTFTGGGYQLNTTGSNTLLKPEFSKTWEYGGEFKLFNNKLSLDITRYETRSTDQIIAARTSYGTGFIVKYINGGEVTNKGIEILATVEPIKTKNVYWKSTFTFAANRGVITRMPQDLPTYYNSDTWVAANLRSQMYVGAANGNLAGYISARNTKGDLLIDPATGLPTYSADFYSVGNRQPDWTGGWVNRLDYKEFTLSFTVDVRHGGQVFNGNEFITYHLGLSPRTVDRDKLVVYKGVLQDGMQNTATPTVNTITVNPLTVDSYYSSVSANPESQFVETVNWVRLRDLTLAYNLPTAWLKKQHIISQASLFVTGVDLFMITNYSGADPSVNVNTAGARGYGGAGIDYGALATPRGLNVGCKVKF